MSQHIPIDESSQEGRNLKRFRQQAWVVLDQHREISAKLAILSDQQAEQQYGLQPGDGAKVKALVAQLSAAIPVDAVRNALIRLG